MVAIDIHCSTRFLVPASMGDNHLMLIGIFHLLYGLIKMIWRIITWGKYQILPWYHYRNWKWYLHGTDDIVIFTTETDECILIHNHTVLSLSFVNKDNGFRSWNTSLKLAERILQYTPTEIFVDFKGIHDWFSLNLSIVSTKKFSAQQLLISKSPAYLCIYLFLYNGRGSLSYCNTTRANSW